MSEEMSLEELIDKMLLCSEEHLQSGINEHTQYIELKQEILSRFAEITEKVREANNCCPIRRHNDKT